MTKHTQAVELRHMRYVVAVAEHGSFNRAAAALHVAQPALSRQIRATENQLGEALFERTRTGVRITSAGAALVEHARRVLALADATPAVVTGRALDREIVTVGLPPGISSTWSLEMVLHLRRETPRCALRLLEASSREQLHRLAEGPLDVAVVHQLPPGGLVSRVVLREPLGVAIRPGHPLAARASYRLIDLHDLVVMVHSRDQIPTQQDGVLSAAAALGVTPRWVFVHFVEHALSAVEAEGADAVLVNSHTARKQLPSWTWRVLEDLELPMTTWIARRPDTRGIVQTVFDQLVDHTRSRPAGLHDDQD